MLLQQNLELLYCIYYQRKHINGSMYHRFRQDLQAAAVVGTMPLFGRVSERMETATSNLGVRKVQLCVFADGDISENDIDRGEIGKKGRKMWGVAVREHRTPPLFGPSLIRDCDSPSLRLIMSDPGLVGTCFTFIGIVTLYLPHR